MCIWALLVEEGMATHSSILVWRIPWTEEPGGYSLRRHKESDVTDSIEHTYMGIACVIRINEYHFKDKKGDNGIYNQKNWR